MQSRRAKAGFDYGCRLYRNARNRAHTGHFQRYCHRDFKKTEHWVWNVNYDYIQNHQVTDVEIVSSEQIDIEESEMDEMWSFVHDKSQQYWLWWAIDHNTGVPLAYCFGTRQHKYLNELQKLLTPFNIKIVYSDDNYAYKKQIKGSVVITGKRNTQKIERKHLSLRTWCARLVRKGIRFSKRHLMHRIVIGLAINFWFFGRKLPLHII
jgi:insertion element IS1 protein InsB